MILIAEKIKEVCKLYNNNIAVIYYDGIRISKYSYLDLEIAVATLKQGLLNHLENWKPRFRTYIGILLHPECTCPAVVVSILACGYPFVCFHTNRSKEWAKNLIKSLNIKIILTDSNCSKLFSDFLEEFTLIKDFDLMNRTIELWAAAPEDNVILSNFEESSNQLSFVYAIQTSGSTGEPKIVQVPENCILPNVLHLRELFGIDSSDVIYFSTPITFDPNVVELLLTLTSGATLFIVLNKLKAATHEILNIMFPVKVDQLSTCVTFVQTTPSIFLSWPEEFIRERVMNEDTNLKVLALGGECCPSWDILSKFRSIHNKTKMFYLYGITEVSCWASAHLVGPTDNGSNLGIPLKETVLQVRNDDGMDIDEGIGEMFIGSTSRYCLIGDEKLNDIKLPVFRSTGDIVKVSNKELFYIGRKNRVVKRWGQRVCLPQIEKVTLLYKLVKYCSCYMDESYGVVLFMVLSEVNKECNYLAEIRSLLKRNINQASVPDFIFCIDDIPRTDHGKVNYTELRIIMKSKVESLRNSAKPSCEISKEDVKLKLYSLWLKYTHFDGSLAKSIEISTLETSNVDLGSKVKDAMNGENGFLKSGGNSISSIQFISELLEFTYVPYNLNGLLLRDCTFIECYKLLFGDCDRAININEVENEIVESNFGHGSSNASQSKRSINELDSSINNKTNKKQNLHMEVIVLNSKCRGKILHYLSHEKVVVKPYNKINLEVKWRYNLKKCVDASPTVVTYIRDKKLVLSGSHSGDVAVLNFSNGELVSFCHLPDRVESSALVSACGNYYYIGCYDNSLYCISISSGEILWKFTTLDMVKSTPVLGVNFTLIIGSYDHNIYCICSKTAKEIWRYKGVAAFTSVPLLIDNKVVVACLDGMCIVLSAVNGDLLWNFKLSSPIFSSPAMFESKVVFAEVNGTLHCFNLATGERNWTFVVNGQIFSSLTVSEINNETVIIFGCHDCFTYCISVTFSPKIIWKTAFDSPIFSTPFVLNNLVAICTTKGIVNILNLDNGSVASSLMISGEIFSSPIIEEDCVILGCRDNHVYCLQIINCT